ncbi:MAG: group II intron reverse transcriptase domain-containing protein [Kouleothrix sp.]|jgi:retron-type reverse transcriptase|nr:group II intron reverse transcriptase domain-containing protein [Kouleothrix sp.]
MPKTYRNLWPQLVSFENLWRAYLAARRGKRARPAVAAYDLDAETRLLRLQERLEDDSYTPGPYRSFVIREWKRRQISAAPFEDRIVHHALCQVIEPIWEARFIHDSYACRVGKGTLAALDRAQHLARGYRYVLQLDIRAFFPAIDHAVLEATLAHHIADVRVRDLCGRIIAGGRDVLAEAYTPPYFPGDDLFAILRPRGLPIGNLTSQFWANVFLHPLDLFIKQDLHCRAYVRYCDDLLLFADDKATLHAWRGAVQDRLAALRLTIHEARAQVAPTAAGFPFLGWVVDPARRRLRRRSVVRFWRRYRARVAAYAAGAITFAQLDATVQGWIGQTQHGSTLGLRRAVLGTLVPRVNHAAASITLKER